MCVCVHTYTHIFFHSVVGMKYIKKVKKGESKAKLCQLILIAMGTKSPVQYLLVKGLIINVQILVHKLCCSHNNHHFPILFLGIPKLRVSKFFLKTNNFFLITFLSPYCRTEISFYIFYFFFQRLMFTRRENDK